MVIDLVDHVPDVYLSLYSELTAVHVVYIMYREGEKSSY